MKSMSDATIQLELPEKILARVVQIADDSERSVESVLVDGLSLLFGDLSDGKISLESLKDYTDEQLWAVVHQRLAWPQDTRLRELAALGDHGKITVQELEEMDALIALVDQQMLLRSEALLLLKRRGHDIGKYLQFGA